DAHKFSFEAAAERAAHDLRRLGENSVDLGNGFRKLIDDGNASLESSDVLVDIKFKHDDALISHDFFKVGVDFVKAAESQHKIDIKEIPVIKVIDKSSPILSLALDGDGGTPAVVTDLLKYEADLKITGLDFLKIAPGLGDASAETLGIKFNNLSLDFKE